MKNKYSFIYFDVGGVLLKDYSCTDKWEEMKRDMGVDPNTSEEFEKLWEQYAEKRVCLDYDVDNLLPLLKVQLGLNLLNSFSLLQDFVDRFERNEDIWSIVERVRKQSKIGLLTNMYPRMLAKIKEADLLDDVAWDVIVDSSEVKLQKPDKQIFEYAQKMTGVESDQILFIDNSKSHLETARQLGWQIYHYDSCNYQKSNEDLLNKIGEV